MTHFIKIHGSIKLMLGTILIIPLTLLIGGVGALFLKNSFINLGLLSLERNTFFLEVTGGIIIWALMALYLGYGMYQYKRWKMGVFFVLFWLPVALILIIAFGESLFICVGEIFHNGFSLGIRNLIDGGNTIMILPFLGISTILIPIYIKGTFEYIRLFRRIKEFGDLKFISATTKTYLQDEAPSFGKLLFVILISLSIALGGLMVALYNPITPLDIPPGYFTRSDFDFDNPVYTDPKICEQFATDIGKYERVGSWFTKNDPHEIHWLPEGDTEIADLLSAKTIGSSEKSLVIFSIQSTKESTYQDAMEMLMKDENSRNTIRDIQKDFRKKNQKLENFIQNSPILWKKNLSLMRSRLSDQSVKNLQRITDALPNSLHCSIRNDEKILEEFFPKGLSIHGTAGQLYTAAIQLALWEGDTNKAIGILESFHRYALKLHDSLNLGVWDNLKRIIILQNEFKSIEKIIEKSSPTQITTVKNIYALPYDITELKKKVLKGEYYIFQHMFTGRKKSLNQISIPYLFNAEDMVNKGTLLSYAPILADISHDTLMKEKIEKSRNINTGSISKYGWISWLGYNGVGNSILDEYPQNYNRMIFHKIDIYQDYIRHDLLKFPKESPSLR